MGLQTTACAKIILLGEHAVVYGQPAIAIPVSSLRAHASLEPGGSICILAMPDIGIEAPIENLPEDQPLAFCLRLACKRLGISFPAGTIRITSSIPVASGLGSGAAVSTAMVRLAALVSGFPVSAETVSSIVFEVERLYHGTPSGVDNTVIAWERPIWFISGKAPLPLRVAQPIHLLIADSGVPGETKAAVGGVHQRWQAEPDRYQKLFEQIGFLAKKGRSALESGDLSSLGAAMRDDHLYLREMGVSTPGLDRLVDAATAAGAEGAKLSGGGLGGHILALVDPAKGTLIEHALRAAGAISILRTILT